MSRRKLFSGLIAGGVCLLMTMIVSAQSQSVGETITVNMLDTGKILKLIKQGNDQDLNMEDSSFRLYKEALQQSEETGYAYGAALACYNISAHFSRESIHDSTYHYAQQGLRSALNLKQDSGITGKLYNILGSYYFHKRDYPSASLFLYKSIEEIEQKRLTDPIAVAAIYNNIGYIWICLKNAKPAMFYLQRAEAIVRVHKIYSMQANCFSHLGLIQTELVKDYQKGREYYSKALQLGQSLKDKDIEKGAILNIGNTYLLENKPSDAIPYFKKVLSMPGRLMSRMEITVHGAYGMALYDLKRYSEARENLEYAENEMKAIATTEYVPKVYYALSKIYAALNQKDKAYVYLEKYANLNDSFNNVERDRIIYELDSRYRTSEKDKQLANQQLQLANQQNDLRIKNIWLFAVSSIVLLVALVLIAVYRINKHRRQLQEAIIRNLTQDREIAQLKAQINGEEKERARMARELHDGVASQMLATRLGVERMRNQLIAINPEELDDTLSQLQETAMEVRRMAHNLTPDILSHDGLAVAVANYCGKIDRSSDLNVICQVQGDIPRFEVFIELSIYRMIQEFIQNTLKHAQATELLVQISFRNSLLSISVEDNGSGFSESDSQNGIGIESVKARVKALDGTVEILSEMGTSIYLEFDTESFQPQKVCQ